MAMMLGEIHTCFREALGAVSARIDHEGEIERPEDAEVFAACDGPLRLQLAVRNGMIMAAAHGGAGGPASRAMLEAYCQAVVGLPLAEAAEHAGHHVVASLRDTGMPAPVEGILTPANAGPLFELPLRLIRRIYETWGEQGGMADRDSLWNPPLSKEWLTLDPAARLARLAPVADGFLAARGLGPADLRLVEVEQASRVFVGFGEAVAPADKPGLLMDLEGALRAATGNRLEVYMQDMKDNNHIRRL